MKDIKEKNNLFNQLENIMPSLEAPINELIHNEQSLFTYNNISYMTNIYLIFQEVKIVYECSLRELKSNIPYIRTLEKMLKNKRIGNHINSEGIFSDLFLEVEAILAFSIINFNPDKELIEQFNYDYHHLKMHFLYIFSVFDIVATLLYHHNYFENYGIDEYDKKLKNVYFHKIDTYLSNKNKVLRNRIEEIVRSKSFRYIKDVRNNLSHHFNNPILRYHFSFDIMICFIILSKLVKVIKDNIF